MRRIVLALLITCLINTVTQGLLRSSGIPISKERPGRVRTIADHRCSTLVPHTKGACRERSKGAKPDQPDPGPTPIVTCIVILLLVVFSRDH